MSLKPQAKPAQIKRRRQLACAERCFNLTASAQRGVLVSLGVFLSVAIAIVFKSVNLLILIGFPLFSSVHCTD